MIKDTEKLIDYLCRHMEGNTDYSFYKTGVDEIGIIQKPFEVRDKKPTLSIKVKQHDQRLG